MSASRKTAVIEALFNKRWRGRKEGLSSPIVTLVQVQEAIRTYNKTSPKHRMSPRNPANFFKDFIRKRKSANENWPKSVASRGYTARQLTGEGLCFEFIPLPHNQADPFPISGITPSANAVRYQIQSASMPLASRRLGRKDEAWLIQVLARLHVIETHLALHSPRRFLQVDLLQTNVKLAKAEIDALYLGQEHRRGHPDTELQEVLITCEAKGRADDILEDQVVAQVKAVFRMREVTQDMVVPMAVKAIGPSEIYVVQFSPVQRDGAAQLSSLAVQSDAVYQLVPMVPGVGR